VPLPGWWFSPFYPTGFPPFLITGQVSALEEYLFILGLDSSGFLVHEHFNSLFFFGCFTHLLSSPVFGCRPDPEPLASRVPSLFHFDLASYSRPALLPALSRRSFFLRRRDVYLVTTRSYLLSLAFGKPFLLIPFL